MEEPFLPEAGVVLIRSEAEEAQLRIREAAAEVRPGLSVEGAYRESLHTVRVRRSYFCVEVRVPEARAALLVEEVPPLLTVTLQRANLLKRFDHSVGRWPLRLKTVR